MRSIAGPGLAIAAATLLLLPVLIVPSPALASGLTRCPCNFLGALAFASRELATFGERLEVQECTKSSQRTALSGTTKFCSVIELEAENSSESDETPECGYEVACPTIEDGDAPLFILKYEKDNLSVAQYQACALEIKLISKLIFNVNCLSDD